MQKGIANPGSVAEDIKAPDPPPNGRWTNPQKIGARSISAVVMIGVGKVVVDILLA